LHGGGRRFESGWLHSADEYPVKPAVRKADIVVVPRLAAKLTCLLSGLLLATAGTALANEPTVTEFETGLTADNGAWGVAAGEDGNLWVTESLTSQIARVAPDGTVTEFGGLMGNPKGIAAGPDTCLWFVEAGGSGVPGSGVPAIGHITPDGTITEFTAGLSADAEPVDIALGSDGAMWFTERSPARIGRADKDGVITEFSAGLTPGSEPMSITAGPDGNMWFTEAGGTGAIGRITPDGTITEFTLGLTPGSAPAGIAAGPDGNLWFTEFNNPGAIARITKYGVITEFSTGLSADSEPMGIAAGADGAIWFAASKDPGRIGRITVDGVISEHTSGLTPNGMPWRLTSGPDGNIWFTELASPGRLARITVPPGADTKPATSVGERVAELRAKLRPNSQATSYYFEYGPTSDYGEKTDEAWVPLDEDPVGPLPVATPIEGLEPASDYHFRVVATNDAGTTVGQDRVLKTHQIPPRGGDTRAVEKLPKLRPELGESVVLAPASGVVRVKVPGRRRFAALVEGSEIPVGSVIDTRRGQVALTSALNADGESQTGRFNGGLFVIRQRPTGRGFVDLHLRGASFKSCGRAESGTRASAAGRRRVRRLWGRDSGGRFRTHGRNSHATVRGTVWLTEDRCKGTLTRVRRGRVVVRDLLRKKSVMVRAGHSYLARSRR